MHTAASTNAHPCTPAHHSASLCTCSHTAHCCRTRQSAAAEADALYSQLCPALLSRLELLASSGEPKYTQRLRLENYVYLGEALQGLAARQPALQQHWQVRAGAAAAACVLWLVSEQSAASSCAR